MIDVDKLPPKINENALDILKEIKEKVKSGEITSMGVAYVTRGGGIAGLVSESDNCILQWAALEHVARDFYVNEFTLSD